MKNAKKRVYMTRKMKAKKATRKYVWLLVLGLMIPNAIIGYYSNELIKEVSKDQTYVNIVHRPEIEEIKVYEVKSEVVRTVTMYNSVEWQTDSTPCISANNTNICEGLENGINYCASNAYPFGTVLHVDKLGECVVADRMNRRYPNRIDWYAGMDIERAISFGKQNLNIKEVTNL